MSRLRDLLDRAAVDHRRDIKLYCSGHLNENHLFKPSDKSHSPWEFSSSAIRLPRWRPPIPCMNHPVRRKDERSAQNRQSLTVQSISYEGRPKQPTSNSQKEKLKSTDSHTTDTEANERAAARHLRGIELAHKMNTISNYLETTRMTKADQYRDCRHVDDHIVQSSRSHQFQALRRTRNMDEIETRFRRRLCSLSSKQQQLSYHRLQIHRSCLDDITENCKTFGFLLRRIQIEFDHHISYLLDRLALRNQMELKRKLEEASLEPSVSEEIRRAQREVKQLEERVKELLDRNENLRVELQQQGKRPHHSTPKSSNVYHCPTDPACLQEKASVVMTRLGLQSTGPPDLGEKVEDLHYEIHHQLETREAIRLKQRNEMVPILECQRLEQCIRDTSSNIQQLVKRNDLLQKEIIETEAELEDAVEATDASQRDVKMLWKKVNAFRVKKVPKKDQL
ncbi:uncharacterized protein LOC134187238 [Corticium candelabrum]|uniref:uncharacterized protein LOC134187238 n=1 Tax=Corticium candelabrum TaxID=121492 RepID=UPI002E27627C|nr:uncharacterized protein LOC134187238 [Corticium candelabrum]XP_062511339.1 uncharacterized protein LOC134187238 [Corticium candelabrum]